MGTTGNEESCTKKGHGVLHLANQGSKNEKINNASYIAKWKKNIRIQFGLY